MTTVAGALQSRESFHGVRQILRFNWPFYAVGAPVAFIATYVIEAFAMPGALQIGLYLALALVWLWLFGSIAASWLVYDRSELMTGSWIPRVLDRAPLQWIAIHGGLDEMTPILERVFGTNGRAFDIFDPAEMTEPSISRARISSPTDAAEQVDFRRLPVPDASLDAAFLLLSAHELRTHESRSALFAEIRRALKPGGHAIVAEHLRDLPNFVAYGPGALHFHSRRTWLRTFDAAGLAVAQERSITPFVHVFVLRRPS
jgi:SAM-dependent methyltransferase